jgi:protein SCO1/2
MPKKYLVVLAATVGVAIGLGAALVRTSRLPAVHVGAEPLKAEVTWSAGTKRAPAFALRDQHGTAMSLAELRGHAVLLTFLDSVCKRECPIEGRVLADLQRKLRGTDAVTAVVSVDPWSDTAATASAFARKSKWAGLWYWLLGSRARLAPVWRAYSVGVRRGRGDVAHAVVLYLIDPRGYLRAGYLFPFSPTTIFHDVHAITGAT